MRSPIGTNAPGRSAGKRDMMSGRGFAIDVEISIFEPGVVARMPAVEDSLPAARQVLRALGDTIAAEREAIEDAELALTEACANVVEHAYPDSAGTVEVTLSPRDEEMVISVRDFGRGMPAPTDAPREDPGHGLVMIEGIARKGRDPPRRRHRGRDDARHGRADPVDGRRRRARGAARRAGDPPAGRGDRRAGGHARGPHLRGPPGRRDGGPQRPPPPRGRPRKAAREPVRDGRRAADGPARGRTAGGPP